MKKKAIINIVCLLMISTVHATVIESLPDFDSVAGVEGATNVIFDLYVPDTNGATNSSHFVNSGQFTGFYDGLNGQPNIGLLVDGSKNQVVFADYTADLTYSSIAGGDFQNSTYLDSGISVTFTFVDPSNSSVKVSVSRVAFELVAVGQGDNVTASFLDAGGATIYTTGILADGRYGYVSRDGAGGTEVSEIHQLVLTSNGSPPQLWTIGHSEDPPYSTIDFSFAFPPLVDLVEEGDDTAVNEEGPTSDTYTVALGGSGPQQDVTLTLNPSESDQVLLEVDGIETDTIIFTSANFDQPRTVTVTAVNDALSEATHYVIIAHSSSSVDSTYNNLVIPDIRVKITDNDGNRIKVFLIGGQSNAAGSGLNSEYPPLYQSLQYDVEFWVGGRLPGDGVPDYTSWDRDADTAFRPLEQGSGNQKSGTQSGCELSLGRTLKDALPYDNIAIVKYGMSGSALLRGLRSGDGAGDWDSGPPAWSPSEGFDGVRYHVFMNSAVFPALQAITDRGDVPEIAAMFWMQGETDAGNSTAASQYEANLNDLISSVRTELSAPDMKFVIGRLKPTISRSYVGTVIAAEEAVAAADDNAFCVNTDDLPFNSDNIHYSAAGQVGMGERFADTYLSTLPKRGDFEPDGDIDLIDFARFAEQWLSADCGFCFQADLNSDLDVNVEDFLIITESWLDGSATH